jgi:diguanylate cyclase (GGDEF)-like protein
MKIRAKWVRQARMYGNSLHARVSLSITGLLMVVMALTVGVADYGLRVYASSVAERDLIAGSKVFQHNLSEQQIELRSAGEVVARDFGFRAAFASGDRNTLVSALSSLASRAHARAAIVIGLDGTITASPGTPTIDGRRLLAGLNNGADGGVIMLGKTLASGAAARIEMPDLAGWLVLARPLDQRELAQFARLSAIPVDAQVALAGNLGPDLADVLPGTISHRNGDGVSAPSGAELVQTSPLPALQSGLQPVLALRYPLASATAAYQTLRLALATISLIALAMGVFMASRIARSILLPLNRLARATASMSRGEMARVEIRGRDELATLAQSYNAMVDSIEERERRITHAWLHDGLTNLPNRRFFQEKLDRAVSRQGRDSRILVVVLDLDDFKLVNDTMGHDVGDALLRHFAALLPELAPNAQVARFGNDEFALLADYLDVNDDIASRVEGFARKMVADVHISGKIIPLSVSFGIAVSPDDAHDGATLIKHAELALSRAKRDGKRIHRFFEATLDEAAVRRRMLEIDLREALRNGEFELHFQPLFSPSECRIKGFEALLRWHHPQRGLINPAEFIPIAEHSGLIIAISEWVIREACAQAVLWPDDVCVAVNISPRHFEVPGLIPCVISALAHTGLSPHRLELEITESVFINEFAQTIDILRQLRGLGVRIALDDFGTGYSSLSYLRSFPFDKVKIDQSFVRDLASDASARAIVRAITALAGALGMETLAEGVEDVEQYDALIAEGCLMIQGYLISRPVPVLQAIAVLARWNDHDTVRARLAS